MAIRRFVCLAIVFGTAASLRSAHAEKIGGTPDRSAFSWPDKSGPFYNGNAAAEDSVGIPTTWNEATGENIAWKIKIEGKGHSTPVIGAGRLWFTSATEDGKQQFVYCIDEATGKTIHHKLLFENPEPEPLANNINTYASPSCVLEPDGVYVHFGSYGTARLNPETAEVMWQRRDLPCRHFRGPGSSPVVFENLVILTFDGIDQHYVTALDKNTGKTVWRTDRSVDYKDVGPDGKVRGDGDFRKAYNTPSIVDINGMTQLISVSAKASYGYEPRTGKQVWIVENDDYNAAARPVAYKGTVIINTGSNNANLFALKMDDTTRGNVGASHVLWDRNRGNAKMSSPVLTGNLLFMVTDDGIAYCLDADTGKEHWGKRLKGKFVATPVIVNGLVLFCDEKGITTIVKAADQYEEVARNELADGMRASPAIAHGAIFLRTFDHLYKIAAKAK